LVQQDSWRQQIAAGKRNGQSSKIVGLADRIIRGTITSRAATLTALGPASVLFRHV
jgi:hypothetical protein